MDWSTMVSTKAVQLLLCSGLNGTCPSWPAPVLLELLKHGEEL